MFYSSTPKKTVIVKPSCFQLIPFFGNYSWIKLNPQNFGLLRWWTHLWRFRRHPHRSSTPQKRFLFILQCLVWFTGQLTFLCSSTQSFSYVLQLHHVGSHSAILASKGKLLMSLGEGETVSSVSQNMATWCYLGVQFQLGFQWGYLQMDGLFHGICPIQMDGQQG